MQIGNNLVNGQYNPKKLTLAFLSFIYLNKFDYLQTIYCMSLQKRKYIKLFPY